MIKSIPKTAIRIGILGGTFDPVHLGHLAAAQAALQGLDLDRVLFIPACRPPHKLPISVTPFTHRSAMLDLALADFAKFCSSDLEASRGGPSYTCDTLADLRGILGADRKLFFITGIDAFYDIHTWKNYSALPHYADFVILRRPPYSQKRLAVYLEKGFPAFNTAESSKFHLVSMHPVDISSTLIRRRTAENLPIDHLTSLKVLQYILAEGLYK